MGRRSLGDGDTTDGRPVGCGRGRLPAGARPRPGRARAGAPGNDLAAPGPGGRRSQRQLHRVIKPAGRVPAGKRHLKGLLPDAPRDVISNMAARAYHKAHQVYGLCADICRTHPERAARSSGAGFRQRPLGVLFWGLVPRGTNPQNKSPNGASDRCVPDSAPARSALTDTQIGRAVVGYLSAIAEEWTK